MKTKTKSKILTLTFLIFIFAMSVLFIVLPKNDFSATEKRYLADFPKFSFKSLSSGDFTSDFEEYLTDHVPFRNFFVSVNSYFELAKGNNGSNGIYLGSDGWLIEKPVDRENRLALNMKRIVSFSEKSGIPAALTVVPSKGFIYSEYLPKNALEYNDSQYIEAIRRQCSDKVVFADMTEKMKSVKNEKQLFYKTDHHWTSEGAYIGYESICEALSLTPTPEISFDKLVTDDFYGTSYSTSLYTLTKPDIITIMPNKKTGGKAEVEILDGEKTVSGNMFFKDALKENDKYVVFLNGNHPYASIKTGNPGGRLLLIKDSFAHCLAPFLAENYSEIIMIDLRYYKKPVSKLLETEKFDQILFVYGMENLTESKDIILK